MKNTPVPQAFYLSVFTKQKGVKARPYNNYVRRHYIRRGHQDMLSIGQDTQRMNRKRSEGYVHDQCSLAKLMIIAAEYENKIQQIAKSASFLSPSDRE